MSLDPHFPDFDMMMALHRDDPEAFEAFRSHLLHDAVHAAPPGQHPALELLVGQLDVAHMSDATPMEAAIGAFRMMQESVAQLHVIWRQARHVVAGMETVILMTRMRRS